MQQINILDEIIVDNFAGGGGASTGIELATGRPVTIAINHDPDAILMHKTNHPYTEHYQESVWDIDPVEVCRGRKVGLAWFSPDCKHFSKAKGGKPVDKNIRGLAWIVLKWAGTVRPRVIILENVEEFQTWGPVRKGKPVKSHQGETFQKWKSQLEALGYVVEHRELKACDYGAPTIRKRFFLIARCDGKPIVWPKPTHGSKDSPEVKSGKLKPYKTAADCIDFDLPCPSIFNRKKRLANNTLKRIAKGLDKFVIKEHNPYLISNKAPYIMCNNTNNVGKGISSPIPTITTGNRNYLISPYLSQLNHSGENMRGQSTAQTMPTITAKHGFAYIAPSLIQYHSETAKGEVRGQKINNPIFTVDGSNRYGLQIPYLSKFYGGVVGAGIKRPVPTVTAIDHNALTAPFLTKHSPGCNLGYWNKVRELLNTYTDWNLADDEILIFNINGVEYFIYDIGLRMLQPKELYRAQGFPNDYIIDHDYTGKKYPKTKQVARCGNAVPPAFAKALVQANLPEMCKGVDIASMYELNDRIAV